MTRLVRGASLTSLVLLAVVVETAVGKVLITQAFKGRAFGSPSSDEVSQRIRVGADGSMYIAGITTSRDPEKDAWGHAEAGESTGQADVFVAKLSAAGKLLWVRRTGSPQSEVLNDLQISNNAVYICGSTSGDFGKPVNGSSDAFILKLSANGEKAWRRAFQFGSAGTDTCKSLAIDPQSGAIFAVGNTDGVIFGSTKPPEGSVHDFVVKLEELDDYAIGLSIVRGRQRGSVGSSSADQVAISKGHVLCMTTSWSERTGSDHRVTTYLSEIDSTTLFLHSLHNLKSVEGDSFRGMRMAVSNDTGDAFLVGITTFENTTKGYFALRYSSSMNDGKGGIQWDSYLGDMSPVKEMLYHTPAIAASARNGLVYVAGTEEGAYYKSSERADGIVIVPFLELNMTTGKCVQKWHRTVPLSTERQELTDIAKVDNGEVVYTGIWNSGANQTANALVGSFGSSAQSSRADGSQPVETGMQLTSGEQSKEIRWSARDRSIGFIILGMAGAGIVLAALFVRGLRASKRKVELDDSETDATDSQMQIERKLAAASYRKKTESDVEAPNIVVGGSAAPQ